MLRASGVLVFALVTLVVCCRADPRREQEEPNSADRYDNDIRERQELERFFHFLLQAELRNGNGRNLDGIGGALLGRSLGGARVTDGLGGSSLLGRSLANGKNLDDLGGSTLLGRSVDDQRYARFVDSLGGGNFVRTLDPIGGGNLVKKNLDAIGGPNLVKRHLDSLGGGNFVRTLDSIGGGNFVRELDSIGGGNRRRNLDPVGGHNLVRPARDARRFSHLGRRYEYLSPFGSRNLVAPFQYAYGLYGDGLPKRNFDEIDRSNLNTFVKKRNFDEIDQTSMPFPFKRFFPLAGPNYLDIPVSSLDKKHYRPDYPMDEIDFSQFPIGSKRSPNPSSLAL